MKWVLLIALALPNGPVNWQVPTDSEAVCYRARDKLIRDVAELKIEGKTPVVAICLPILQGK